MANSDRKSNRNWYGLAGFDRGVDEVTSSRTVWFAKTLLMVVIHVLVFGYGAVGFASIWYVNNVDGRDTNNGLNETPSKTGTGPFRSIGRALKAAKAGDSIVLANTGRPYYESISISGGKHSGLVGRPFAIIGNGATLSGLAPVDSTKWKAIKSGFYKLPNRHGNFGQLFQNGRPLPYQNITLKDLDSLKPMHWTMINGHFYFRTEKDQLASTFNLDQSFHLTGVTLYNVDNVVVQDLIVQGFALDGINAFDGVTASKVRGVNTRGNGRSGLSVGGAAKLSVEDSTIGDNLKAQIRTEVLGSVHVKTSSVLEFAHGVRLDQKGGKIQIEN